MHYFDYPISLEETYMLRYDVFEIVRIAPNELSYSNTET